MLNRNTALALLCAASALLPQALATTTSWGTVNATRDTTVEWDVTSYGNTTAFCEDWANQCTEYVEDIGTISQIDCVSSQPGPDVLVYCGGNSVNYASDEFFDYTQNVMRFVNAETIAGPGESATTTSSSSSAAPTKTKAAATKTTKGVTKTTASKFSAATYLASLTGKERDELRAKWQAKVKSVAAARKQAAAERAAKRARKNAVLAEKKKAAEEKKEKKEKQLEARKKALTRAKMAREKAEAKKKAAEKRKELEKKRAELKKKEEAEKKKVAEEKKIKEEKKECAKKEHAKMLKAKKAKKHH